MSNLFTAGQFVQLVHRPPYLEHMPKNAIGCVVWDEREPDAGRVRLVHVEWDHPTDARMSVRAEDIRAMDDIDLCQHTAKTRTCGTPWWHVWNPCSRFGWITYMIGGAFVPSIVEWVFA